MQSVFGNARPVWRKGAAEVNAYVDFAARFEARPEGGPYVLNISADAQYIVYLNGRYVNGGQYADFPNYKVYDALDLTPFVRPGRNILKIGGYCPVTDSSTYRLGHPSVIFAVKDGEDFVLESGEDTLCAADPCYKSGAVDRVTGQLGYSFEYDARPDSFFAGETIDESAMERAILAPMPEAYYPRPIRKLDLLPRRQGVVLSQGVFSEAQGDTVGQRVQYASMAFREFAQMTGLPAPQEVVREAPLCFACPDGEGIFLVIDLMENDAGYIDLDIELNESAEILLGWGEHLDDLRVRAYRDGRNFAARYMARAGRQQFTYLYRRNGLRYLQLLVYAHEFKLYYAGLRPTVYPVSQGAAFHTADKLHQRIYEISKRTLLNCMHEHYEDCPWREQALYTMDSRNQMLFGYYAFGEYEFARASLRLMSLSIREDGFLELCAPAKVSITIPSFTAVYPVQLQEYLSFSKDKAFAREMLPVAERIGDMFLSHVDETGLIPAFRDKQYWNFYEWQPYLEGYMIPEQDDLPQRYDAPLQAFVSLCLARLAIIEEQLERPERAHTYRQAAQALNRELHRQFYDAGKGLYYSFRNAREAWHEAQLTQALAVYCGACPESELDKVLDHLTGNALVPVTLSHSVFQYDALMKRPERYGRWVFDHVAQVFGAMLENKATTFWETEKGAWDFTNAGSLCHAWSAVPVYLYYAYALGARAGENGAELDRPAPVDSGLYELRATFRLPDGTVREIKK